MNHEKEKWWTRALLATLVVAKRTTKGRFVDFSFLPNIVENINQQIDLIQQLRQLDIIERASDPLTTDIWQFNSDEADKFSDRLVKVMTE